MQYCCDYVLCTRRKINFYYILFLFYEDGTMLKCKYVDFMTMLGGLIPDKITRIHNADTLIAQQKNVAFSWRYGHTNILEIISFSRHKQGKTHCILHLRVLNDFKLANNFNVLLLLDNPLYF